ncbi:HdeD family acid-resistance protein [Natrinema gelatinilyticum]|uniref:HdeD family acid-resistance protein n=1 Tax=Natrinema gelatinilyticum TaxID=2961571 RepID=UPI0020C24E5A|nr:DUF308 domain-containing protein [Natrinema gelatinilyticum]
MTGTPDATDTVAAQATRSTIHENWRALLRTGLVLSCLGLLGMVLPLITDIPLSLILGTLLIVGGLAHASHVRTETRWTGLLWHVVLSAVYVLGGVAIVLDPLVAVLALTVVLLSYFLTAGIVEIALGFRIRGEKHWIWPVVSGGFSLVLAVFIWVSWPDDSPRLLSTLFGIGLITTGGALILVAIGGRSVARTPLREDGVS